MKKPPEGGGKVTMSELFNPERTSEALRARAELLVALSNDLGLPLDTEGGPDTELAAEIAKVRAERQALIGQPEIEKHPDVAKSMGPNGHVIFEVHGRDGHVWRIYENGRVTGFPVGVIIVNCAWRTTSLLRSEILSLQREKDRLAALVAEERGQIS